MDNIQFSNDVSKQLITCSNCGNQIEKGSLFCNRCGKKLQSEIRICTNCGKEMPGDSSFCPACGSKQTNEETNYTPFSMETPKEEDEYSYKIDKGKKVGIVSFILGLGALLLLFFGFTGKLNELGYKLGISGRDNLNQKPEKGVIDLYDIAHMSEDEVAKKYKKDTDNSFGEMRKYIIDDHYASITFIGDDESKSVDVQIEDYGDEYHLKYHKIAGHSLYETLEEFEKDSKFEEVWRHTTDIDVVYLKDLKYEDAYMHLYVNNNKQIYNMVYSISPGSDQEIEDMKKASDEIDVEDERMIKDEEEIPSASNSEEFNFYDNVINESFEYYDGECDINITMRYEGDNGKEYRGSYGLISNDLNENGDVVGKTSTFGTFEENMGDGYGALYDNIGGIYLNYRIYHNGQTYVMELLFDDGTSLVVPDQNWLSQNAG